MKDRLLAALLALLLLAAGGRVWLRKGAIELANQPGQAALETALKRDGTNPDLHMALGRLLRDEAGSRDLHGARKSMERAVELRPYSATFFAELSSLYELMNLAAEAAETMARAVELNPRHAPYLWRMANLRLRSGATDESFGLIGTAMDFDADLVDPGLSLLVKAGAGAETIEGLWPAGDGMAQRLLEGLLRYRQTLGIELDAVVVERLWKRAVEGRTPPDLRATGRTVRYFVDAGRLQTARAVWIEGQSLHAVEDEAYTSSSNAVWNGGFELPISVGDLEWRVRKVPGWRVERAVGSGRGAGSALLIESLPGGARKRPPALLQQLVLVEPGRAYDVSFDAKATALVGGGFVLSIEDAVSRDGLAESELPAGSSSWTTRELELPAAPGHGLARLSVRPGSQRSDRSWSGSLLLDNVRLTLHPEETP